MYMYWCQGILRIARLQTTAVVNAYETIQDMKLRFFYGGAGVSENLKNNERKNIKFVRMTNFNKKNVCVSYIYETTRKNWRRSSWPRRLENFELRTLVVTDRYMDR